MESFSELKLSPALAKAVAEMGFVVPTPVQAQALPLLLGGTTDLLAMAATGTGKTAAYGIPLLEALDPKIRATQAVVLCPTRELAIQVAEQLSLLGQHKRIHAHPIYGGTGYSEQVRGLKRGAYVVVATPGRLIDHLKRGTFSLDSVTTVVLDEADEMISMGFKEDLEFVLQQVSEEQGQRWMFAATMNSDLRKVADTYLREPKFIQINRTQMLSGTVHQIYYSVREKNKPKGLCKLIDMADEFYGLVFCQTKALVTELTEYLKVRGYRADCLHGDKSQSEREKTMGLFREKNVNILVCSDVAARGIDVKDITHVINYSLPFEFDIYVHRIGRTGRSGKPGIALSLVSPGQMDLIGRIERRTNTKMEVGTFPSRKTIAEKKLTRILPQFALALGHEKAREALDQAWIKTLEPMSKEEIAGRFLALSFPDLFDDREKAEEMGLTGEREERPRRGGKPFTKFARRPGGPGGRSGGRPWSRKPQQGRRDGRREAP